MNIEEKLVKKLIENKLTISFGESITGGMLASTIINVSGSSNVIRESYVTYSNEVKEKVLGVNKETIDKYTVVSSEVAKEMALGLYKLTKSNICASVSGYAETEVLNQGYAWYAILINDSKHDSFMFTKELKVCGSRNEVRKKVTIDILNNIYRLVED